MKFLKQQWKRNTIKNQGPYDPHDLDDDIDPFADLEPEFNEDEGELENNEHVIDE